jgi:hypothetical protein
VAYTEWLRVRGIVMWTGIMLAVFFVGTVGLHAYFSANQLGSTYSAFERDPATKVSVDVLPDGTRRKTLENAQQNLRVVVETSGAASRTEIHSLDPARPLGSDVSFTKTSREKLARGEAVVHQDDGDQDFAYYPLIAAFVALIVATVLGAPFARENDGHLEIAATKPVARTALAVRYVAVDCAGIAVVWLMAFAVAVATHVAISGPYFRFGPADFGAIALALLGCFAWYAMLAAATATMKRSYGAVLGISWPVVLGIIGMSRARLVPVAFLQAAGNASEAISYLFPLKYLSTATLLARPDGIALPIALGALAALFLAYATVGVAQWRRVEA